MMSIRLENGKFGRGMYVSLLWCLIVAIAAMSLYFYTGNRMFSITLLFGFALSILDSAMGMGFGTVGVPILLVFGFQSIVVVPAILAAQFFASAFGSILHHKYKNSNLFDFKHEDGKIMLVLVIFGVSGAVIGVILGLILPAIYIKIYIGILVSLMGILLLAKSKFNFSWTKLIVFSAVGGFNKALGGGGYGPLSTSSLIASGNTIRRSVGISLFSVAVINVVAFSLYFLSGKISNYVIILGLSFGAIIGSQIGPRITSRMLNEDKSAFGVIIIALGALTVLTAFGILG